jgi:hypothetical protein
MSDENDSHSAALADASEERSSSSSSGKKKDKSSSSSGSKKRKESSAASDSSENTKPKKSSSKEKSKDKSKEKSSKSKSPAPAKKGDEEAAVAAKPKAKKAKGKKKQLFYGTNEDQYLLRSRTLLLRQAAIKRLIRSILMRDEMLSNIRISKNAVIALHTLVNANIQHRFKAAKATMETVHPTRATLSVNYVKASYLAGEQYMGRPSTLPDTYIPLPPKKPKVLTGPFNLYFEDAGDSIRKDLTTDDSEPKEKDVKKEAHKRYDALPKKEKKEYEKAAKEKEEAKKAEKEAENEASSSSKKKSEKKSGSSSAKKASKSKEKSSA